MKKLYTIVFLSFSISFMGSSELFAQCNTAPCQIPAPSVNAQDACVLPNPAGLDCYFGSTTPDAPISQPPSWCTTVENNHFFAFTADAVTASFDICTFGCAVGSGIQAAVLSTADCIDFQFVSPCLGNIASGTCQTLTATNLFPGEVYYLMIDGNAGAQCDYSINGVNPTINGPTQAPCLPSSTLSTYTTNTTSNWTINPPTAGNIQGSANGVTKVDILWAEAGPASVCATSTVCPNAPELCIDIFIGEDVESDEFVDVCQGKTVQCAGKTFSNGGNFPVTLQSYLGCDSVVHCMVHVIPTVTTIENVLVCQGGSVMCAGEEFFGPGTFPVTLEAFQGCDSIVKCVVKLVPTYIGPMKFINLCGPAQYQVCDDYYDQTGIYAHFCTGYLGCDSIVNIDLAVLMPEAHIAPPGVLDCGANQTITLNGTTSTINMATGGVTLYHWSGPGIVGPSNQPTAVVNQPGQYCLIVEHGRGGVYCADTTCVTVTASALQPGANVTGSNLNCISNTTTLMGTSPTSGVNYTWTGPGITPANQFQQNPTVNVGGVYVLTVKNPVNGCTSSATITIISDLVPPTVSAVGDTITCLQSSVTIDGMTDAVSATWNWTGSGINAGNKTLENPNVLVPGNYNVTVTNTVNGCTNTATTTVAINNSNPTATAGPNQTLTCTTPNVNLQGAGTAGGQPITFNWAGPGGFMSNVAQPNVNTAGNYILTVLNTLNGCSKMDTVVIDANQLLPNANAGADSLITCAEPSVKLIGSASSNGANFTATWTGPGINAGNANQYSPTVNLPGTYNLVILNTTNGCTATDQVVVDINVNLPSADAGGDNQLTCANPNGLTLNGNGTPANVTYLWSGPGIGSNNETEQSPMVTQPGTYILVVTDPVNGCTGLDQAEVTQDANVPDAEGGPDRTINCAVISVDFDGSGSTTGPDIIYQWAGPGISGPNASAQSPTGLTVPGTYNLTVTNTSNNCVNTDIVVIKLDTLNPLANAGNPLILNCFNNAIDTLHAAGSNLGPNFSWVWSGPGINAGNQNDIDPVINNAPGQYILTVTNNVNKCTSTAQVNVSTDLMAPVADAGADPTIDCITTSTTIGGASSVGANFTYLWTGPGINGTNKNLATPTVNQQGNYNLVVTNTINGCTATSDVLVNSNANLPTALAGNDGLLTCANPTAILDGSSSSMGVNYQIQWSGPDINAGNQNQPAPSITLPGTYYLLVTDITNSCIKRDTVVVTQNKAIPAADAGPGRILNCQTLNVTLDGSLSEVSATIVYLWTGNGINGTNQDDQSPIVNQPGTYDLLVTDTENGCTSTAQVLVTQDIAAPTANAGADGLITCAKLTQLIDGAGNTTGPTIEYVWEGPGINSGNFNLPSPTVDAAGTYTVTVTNNQNHCTSTDVVLVDENKIAPPIAAGPDREITCAQTTAQLDASGSAGPSISFLWSGPGIAAGNQASAMPTVNLPGMYVLTITDSVNGCTSAESVAVTIDTVGPLVFAGNNLVITCANATTGVTLNSAGSSTGANFTYLWTGPGINTTNENALNPTVLQPGNYTLQITNNDNGCDNTDFVVVNSSQNIPIADAGLPMQLTCAVTSVTLDASGSSSPTGTLTFMWSGPGIDVNNETSETPAVIVSGTYTVTVTNQSTGCSASDEVIVSLDNVSPVVGATSETITCLDLLSTIAGNSNLGGSIYLWTGPSVTAANKNSQTFEADQAGLYVVTVTAPNGCTSTASTTVGLDANVPQGVTNGTILNCINGGISQIAGEVLSPPGSTFSWTGPGIVGSVNTGVVSVSQPGTYTFTIMAPNGCTRPITAVVVADFVKPALTVVAAEELDCNTPEVTINANGSSSGANFNRFWTTINGNFVSGTNTLAPIVDQAGQYQLRIVNKTNGCSDSTQVTVLVDPTVPTGFDLSVKNIRCFGDVNGAIAVNGVLGGTPPFLFALSGNTGSANNQYTGLQAGQYVLTLEDANGCHLDTLVSISEPGQLQVDLGPDIRVSLGEYATVTSQIETTVGIKSATWNYSPGCTDSIPYCETFTYQPFDTYRHILTVVDNNGCVDRDDVLVIVKKARQVYVPNIFNPNSSENYVVTVFAGIDVKKINSFFIFDRWGDEVFQAIDFQPNDFSKGWDGQVKGQDGQLGVYVWYCEVEFIDGETKLFKGDVTLMR